MKCLWLSVPYLSYLGTAYAFCIPSHIAPQRRCQDEVDAMLVEIGVPEVSALRPAASNQSRSVPGSISCSHAPARAADSKQH